MSALALLLRVWVSVNLPGYREDPSRHTYGRFAIDELPPIERALDDRLDWLLEQAEVAEWAILNHADAQHLEGRRAKVVGNRAMALPRTRHASVCLRVATGIATEPSSYLLLSRSHNWLSRFAGDAAARRSGPR